MEISAQVFTSVPQSVSELTVRPGDNITLHCDCKRSTGVYVAWYRNCSHENQPTLVLRTKTENQNKITNIMRPFPHFQLLKNRSSDSYDLLIINITESEEGLYYCGTEENKTNEEKKRTEHRLQHIFCHQYLQSVDVIQ
uniref:Ig-like domain-containing protein n=1 Tax=Echeneis naucrates TaxID=173247 RepID=A0A665X0E5_ECHNA